MSKVDFEKHVLTEIDIHSASTSKLISARCPVFNGVAQLSHDRGR